MDTHSDVREHGDESAGQLPDDMTMTAVTVKRIEPLVPDRQDDSGAERIAGDPPRLVRMTIEGPGLHHARPSGAAPVFKLFIPHDPGGEPEFPVFDANLIPTFRSGHPPIVRSFTAVEFFPRSGTIDFLALDPGSGDWWIDRTSVGDTLGLIGFKHEFAVDGHRVSADDRAESLGESQSQEPPTVIAVGDLSAGGAIMALTRQLPSHARLHTVVGRDSPAAGFTPEPDNSSTGPATTPHVVRVDSTGFPLVTWDDLMTWAGAQPGGHDGVPTGSPTAPGSPNDLYLWLGGEVTPLAALRSEARAAGLDPDRIMAQPYWKDGLTREEFDAQISQRYREAIDAGLDIQDRTVAADLELGQ